jgi:hypothetical protein
LCLFTSYLFAVWFRLRLWLRLRGFFHDLLGFRLIRQRLGFLLHNGWRWRWQWLLFKQQLSNSWWNLFYVERLWLWHRNKRPYDSEDQTHEEYDPKQALELLVLALASRPWQVILSVKR